MKKEQNVMVSFNSVVLLRDNSKEMWCRAINYFNGPGSKNIDYRKK